MKIRLLMNLEGAVSGKKGDVKNVENEVGMMLISFNLVELFQHTPRPKRKPIIVHTRSSKDVSKN